MAKKSKDKGGRGERAAAKAFKAWWGSEFTSTPQSGGFATAKFREDWNAVGDLVTPDGTFPFCVECKWVEGWTFAQLLRNDGCLIFKWWQQTLRECPDSLLPLLVFKQNNHPFYCMVDSLDLPNTSFLDENKVRYFTVSLSTEVTESLPTTVYIMLLDDFFRLDISVWKTERLTLIQERQRRLSCWRSNNVSLS